jgi:AcrR family transcriptional regulator
MTDVAAPRGAPAVRASLIAAAADLFSQRGPANVSVREVARVANVNHGLVHHYFGSKDGLLGAVLDDLGARVASAVTHGDPEETLRDTDGPVARHARIVAQLLLEGRNPADVQTTFPTVDALAATLRARGRSADDAARRAVLAASLAMGWQLFAPFLERAAGLDDGPRTSAALDAGFRRLLRGD